MGLLDRARTEDKRAELEEELRLPPFPEPLRYIWNAFLQMRRRIPAGWSVQPIGFADVHAYSTVTGMNFRPWEVEALFEVDDLWMEVVSAPDPTE